MTWKWDISGLSTATQTLTVYDPDGNEVGSETRDGWTWSGEYPEFVKTVVGNNDFKALYMGNIGRRE